MKKEFFKVILISFFLPIAGIAQPDTLYLQGNEFKVNAIPSSTVFHSVVIPSPHSSLVSKLLKGPKLHNPNVGFTREIYWVMITLKNGSDHPVHELFEIGNPQIDFVSRFKLNGDALELIDETGDYHAFEEHPIKVTNFVFPFDLAPKESASFVFKLDKRNSSLNFPINIWSAHRYFEEHDNINVGYGIYFGFISICALYALLTFLFLKRAIYFWYFFWIVSSGSYAATSLGLSAQFLYPSIYNFNSFFRVVIEIISLFAFLKFSQYFLRIPELFPRINKLVIGITFFLMGSFVLVSIFKNQIDSLGIILLSFFYIVLMVCFVIILLVLIKSYSKQRVNVLFYTFAFGTLIAASLLIIAVEFGVVHAFTINLYLLGSAAELLVFSIAITYQVKNVFDERNALSLKMADQQKELLKAYIEGVELERNRISQELHDDIASRLGNLQRLAGSNTAISEFQNEVSSLHQDVRNLSHALSHHALASTGFKKMVEELAFKISQGSKIEVRVQDYDFPDELQEEMQNNLYRIVQEALENTIKHSLATQVDIQLFKHDTEFVITIEDNGRGIDPLNFRPGIGIKNMTARADQLNADLEFSGSPGKGFCMMVKVPVLKSP